MKKVFTREQQTKGLDEKFINDVAKSSKDKLTLSKGNKDFIDKKGNRVIKLSKNGRV